MTVALGFGVGDGYGVRYGQASMHFGFYYEGARHNHCSGFHLFVNYDTPGGALFSGHTAMETKIEEEVIRNETIYSFHDSR